MGHAAPLGLDVVLQQLSHVHKFPLLDLVGQFGRNCWEAFAKDEWLGTLAEPAMVSVPSSGVVAWGLTATEWLGLASPNVAIPMPDRAFPEGILPSEDPGKG